VEKRISEEAPLVLGSGSPRRREILTAAHVPFVVVVGDADEDVREGEAADAYLARVVLAKLGAVRTKVNATSTSTSTSTPTSTSTSTPIILVADTSVVVDGAILGKPADDEEGFAMIARLRGRTHDVHTRFAVAEASSGGVLHAETVTTRVTFRVIDDTEARAYAASGQGRDKAGGYAVQGAATFVKRIEGSYSNVVGLPACEVVLALRGLGLLG
jgi:septum formation protein